MFKGSYVALVTPFIKGRVDEKGLRSLVDFHVDHGTDGLVPCGTTGESPTLSTEEHGRVIEVVVKAARGRIPVVAGVGSNSTEETVGLVRHAAKVGADGGLVVVPYYNKPTPQGLYEHYRTVGKATKLPLVVYNIPGRTGISMPVETLARVAQDCPTVIGVKESSGSMDYTSHLLSLLGTEKFLVLSGDDSLTLPLMAIGARGVISVLANVIPGAVSDLCRLAAQGNWDEARKLHLRMYPLMRAMFFETNPIPVKTAMAHLRLCGGDVRLPLCPMGDEARKMMLAVLNDCPFVNRK